MNYKKVGLGIALSTAMNFMACGDDSSSSPVFDSPSNQNSSSSVDGGAPKSSPSEKSSSSVAGGVSSSSVAPSSSSVVEAEPCTFAATDNLWEMSYKASNNKGNANVKTIYKIDGENLVILDTIRYTGNQASMICRIADGASDFSSNDGNFVGVQYCDGSTVVIAGTVTQKGYFAANARETVHAAVQKACGVAVNGESYDKIPLATKTTCDFQAEDNVWSYSYLDEGWRGQDSVVVIQSFLFDKKLRVKAEQHPLQHAECIAKNFTDISGNNYCSADGLMDVSSSGITSEKESMYNSELRMCKEKIPAGSETESSSSSVTDSGSSSSTGSVSTGDMVSCDIPGVLGECLEYPAGSDEAVQMASMCESTLMGTLGTGCAK
ncbi:MAG: hypothetical protein IJM92_09085 [Fibrobacter sp.]|uniref:hypothetical protein n=1 Tax=Fibrobacter sp. TaxID=35828 RepID=UPI0025BECB19|nr:hypothetical protein [Fibrobacter sp.]MBQ7079798.1 hypothetical protein [Fibrobacter sp.]